MSAAAPSASRRAGTSLPTRVLAILVLIGLVALASYTMFSGPTTVPLPVGPQAAPTQNAPPEPGDNEAERARGD